MDSKISRFFIVFAAVVIVLTAVKSAAVIVVPFLLSLFLAVIFSPLFTWLNARGLPQGVSLLAVMLLFVVLVGALGMMIGSSVQDFSANLPLYELKLEAYISDLRGMLNEWGIVLPDADGAPLFDPKAAMQYAAALLKNIGSMLADGFVILFTVIFILLEAGQFRSKIDLINGSKEGFAHFEEVIEKIKHYMALKAVISAFTGIVVTVLLMFVGVDYPILWGVIAFLFNFIPNIGSIIAAVPAVLLALIQLGSVSALIVAVIYVAVNVVIGSVVEPKVMGRGLGLSTLVVFLSLIFWGWLLGPVGMLLSIPLTIMAKIAMQSQENTRWVAVLLGTVEEKK